MVMTVDPHRNFCDDNFIIKLYGLLKNNYIKNISSVWSGHFIIPLSSFPYFSISEGLASIIS